MRIKNKQVKKTCRTMLVAVAALLTVFIVPVQAQQLLQYVQPLAGTTASTTFSAVKHSEHGGTEANANTIPAVTVPFAMTQFTPQTRQTENKCVPPYLYKDILFTGLRATHCISGSCTPDYGSFTVMPVVGKLKTTAAAYALPFSQNNEITGAAYYKLYFPESDLSAELTATSRCGIMRFTLHSFCYFWRTQLLLAAGQLSTAEVYNTLNVITIFVTDLQSKTTKKRLPAVLA